MKSIEHAETVTLALGLLSEDERLIQNRTL
jgi:hypothetical protein